MLRWLKQVLGLAASGGDNAGTRAERQAAEWLQQERRFAIVARNWRNPRDRREEIDLVCRDGEVLVFVEVKARAAGALVPGFYAIDARKKRVLRRACDAYLTRLGAEAPRTFRFDVVEVTIGGGAGEEGILHFENVELFSKYYRR